MFGTLIVEFYKSSTCWIRFSGLKSPKTSTRAKNLRNKDLLFPDVRNRPSDSIRFENPFRAPLGVFCKDLASSVKVSKPRADRSWYHCRFGQGFRNLHGVSTDRSGFNCVGSEHCSEHCLFRTSVPNTVSEPLWRSLWSLYSVRNRCSEQTVFGTMFQANTTNIFIKKEGKGRTREEKGGKGRKRKEKEEYYKSLIRVLQDPL